jgi:hypothetical protein
VTLCIAADCDFEGAPAIVLCCDWRAQTGAEGGVLIGTDDVYKIRQRGPATILIAGHPTQGDELVNACKQAIDDFSRAPIDLDHDLATNRFFEALRSSAEKRKSEIIDHHVAMRLGRSYAELLKLPTDNFIELWSEINGLNLGADLIIGIVTNEPTIITLDRWGSVQWHTNYAAIGEGADVARAMLCLQTWQGDQSGKGPLTSVPLPRCLYRVYEAKKASHIANPSSVGEATQFEVLLAQGKRNGINIKGLKVLDGLFNRKHRVPRVSLDKDILVEPNLAPLKN